MTDSFSSIRELIARDQLDAALAACERRAGGHAELPSEILALRARLERIRRRMRQGVLTSEEESVEKNRVCFALLEIVDRLEDAPALESAELAAQPAEPEAPDRSIFISYSHVDSEVMERLQEALEARGLDVWVDRDRLEVGESIAAFIRRSIRATGTTLSLVSSASLLSDWVALESLGTSSAEAVSGRRRWIAGYLDDRCFNPGFRLEATETLDERLRDIDGLAAAHRERQLDTRDLDARRDRLIRLRNGLGDILDRFRDSLMVDLRDVVGDPSALERAADRLVRSVEAER